MKKSCSLFVGILLLFSVVPVFGQSVVNSASSSSSSSVSLWHRTGSIFYARPDIAADQGTNYEPNVIFEATPKIIGYSGSGSIFKFIFTCGLGSPNQCAGESADGLFGQRGTALANTSGYQHGCWMNDGGTYRLFADGNGTGTIDEFTAANSNGTYTSAQTGLIAKGAAGHWDASSLGNCSIVKVASTYYLFYDGNGAACTGLWCEGLATSIAAGGPYTKVTGAFGAGNFLGEIIDFGATVSGSHPDVHYMPTLANPWVMFFHSFNVTSDIYMTTAATPTSTWTTPLIVYRRATPDEGEPQTSPGSTTTGGITGTPQVSDARVIEANDTAGITLCPTLCTWIFYDTYANAAQNNEYHIKAAYSPTSLVQTVQAILAGTMAMDSQSGGHPVQQQPDYQAGHYYGLAPFYWMTRISTNTDAVGELSFSAATTASYTWAGLYGSHPECVAQPQFDLGATPPRYWITYTSTTSFTINFSSAVTGSVSYWCHGRN
jgi:hypothetical protein